MASTSHVENLPPAEGPYDEEEPFLASEQRVNQHGNVYTVGIVAVLLFILLLIATVTFAALYFNSTGSRLPNWPPPSISPLGKYEKAAVAADNEYCSEIGRDTLLKGGNAVDAAIAALFCIGVMDTHSAGMGGGHFMTIYNATTGNCTVVNARETAPASATQDMYKDRWAEATTGWRSIAVPGEVHGLWTEFQRFGSGRVEWSSLVSPTLNLMREGYPTSHALAKALLDKKQFIMSEPTLKAFINPETNDVYKAGEQIRTRKAFEATLEKIAGAADPVELFYKGELARTVTEEIARGDGIITLADLEAYRSVVLDDHQVMKMQLKSGKVLCGPPPPSGAAVAMAILNVLDGYDYKVNSFDDISTLYHHFLEASKFAYAGRSELGDAAFVPNATAVAQKIVSAEWAEWVRGKIRDRAQSDEYYGGHFEAPQVDHGTTHIAVVDKEGNAVSVTSTINLIMGSLRMSEATGILWNDQMDDFSLPGHANFFGYPPSPANFIRPGKRPQSSMSPLVIVDEKRKQLLAVGGAGGSTIISGVAGVALHALWLDGNVKEAIDAPRLHNQLQPNTTTYEERFPVEYVEELKGRGHLLLSTDNLTVVTAVERSSDGQVYANSDFRKGVESAPAGY